MSGLSSARIFTGPVCGGAGAYTHAYCILVVILVIGAVVVMVGAVGVAIIVISRFWLQCCAS